MSIEFCRAGTFLFFPPAGFLVVQFINLRIIISATIISCIIHLLHVFVWMIRGLMVLFCDFVDHCDYKFYWFYSERIGTVFILSSHLQKKKGAFGFVEWVFELFDQMRSRYALYVNCRDNKDAPLHKKLLHLAQEPAKRPGIEVRLMQVNWFSYFYIVEPMHSWWSSAS